MQQYNINDITKGVNGFGRPFPENIYNARLAGTTDTTFTVPGGLTIGKPSPGVSATNRYLLVLKYGSASGATNPSHVFVAINQAADAPNGAVFAADTSTINPDALVVKAGDILHFYAVVANTDVSIEVWPLQE